MDNSLREKIEAIVEDASVAQIDRIMEAVEKYAEERYEEGFKFGQFLMENPL
jgi:hypothetical protein